MDFNAARNQALGQCRLKNRGLEQHEPEKEAENGEKGESVIEMGTGREEQEGDSEQIEAPLIHTSFSFFSLYPFFLVLPMV